MPGFAVQIRQAFDLKANRASRRHLNETGRMIVTDRSAVHALKTKSRFDHQDLIACGHGELFGPGNARLPLPPMLMFDRIVQITDTGGEHGRGEVIAELDIHPDLWFFACHFESDPVMPGCLGLDALWQLTGFFLGWSGAAGRGRALGVGAVKFTGQIEPAHRLVRYRVSIKRTVIRQVGLAFADGTVEADGIPIYEARDLKVGVFSAADMPGTTAKGSDDR